MMCQKGSNARGEQGAGRDAGVSSTGLNVQGEHGAGLADAAAGGAGREGEGKHGDRGLGARSKHGEELVIDGEGWHTPGRGDRTRMRENRLDPEKSKVLESLRGGQSRRGDSDC